MLDIDCLIWGLVRGKAKGCISEGVVGEDPARALAKALTLIKSDVSMSEIETACDRRCTCPLKVPVGGGCGRYSTFSGLVLTI
jgi:hypothetical protein